MKLQRNRFLYCNYPAGTDSYVLSKVASFNIFITIYVLLAVSFGIVHIILKNHLIASALLAGSVIICATRAFLCITRKHEIAFAVAAVIAILSFLASYITGGINNSGPVWFVAFPMAALVLLGPRKGTIASLSLVLLPFLFHIHPLSRLMRTSYTPGFLFVHVTSYLVVFLLALSYELQKESAKKEIRVLKGLIPICSACKKIRDDQGYWNQIEEYIQKNSGARFSHGICPECAEKLYPGFD